jgi:hypothetical protein
VKLANPTDRELNETFAREVAGWKHRLATLDKPVERCGMRLPNSFGHPIDAWWHETDENHRGVYAGPPRFTQSADAVLPWLEKFGWRGTSNRAGSTCAATISVLDGVGTECIAQQDWTHTQTPFPRAAVIALLRAHGIEVEIEAVF